MGATEQGQPGLTAEEAIGTVLDALDEAVIGLARSGEVTWRGRFLRLRAALADEADLRRAQCL